MMSQTDYKVIDTDMKMVYFWIPIPYKLQTELTQIIYSVGWQDGHLSFFDWVLSGHLYF